MKALFDAVYNNRYIDTTFDQRALTTFIVLLCPLPFLLSDQQLSLVSISEIGITSEGGDVTKQLILALLYLGGFFLITLRARWDKALKALGITLIILLAICFVSSIWSELPGVAVRRSVALTGTVAVGLYAGMRLNEDEIVSVLMRSVLIVLGICFIVAMPWPGAGVDPEGRLRGVFAHKNALGAFAGLGILVAVIQVSQRKNHSWHMAAVIIALCIAAMALSDSASPIPVLAVALFVLLLLRASPLLASTMLFALVFAGIVLPLAASELGSIAALFGRDSEFSGRTRVWLFSLEYVLRNPLLGYGYGTFWNTSAGLIFFRWTSFPVAHAHNGFLQLVLDVGILGTLIFGFSLFMVINRATKLARKHYQYGYAFTFGYLAYFIANNLTETRLLIGNELFTMLFVFTLVRANLCMAFLKSKASCSDGIRVTRSNQTIQSDKT